LIFNPCTGNGFGNFIFFDATNSKCGRLNATSGPTGPTIGAQDPLTTSGEAAGPELIERFTEIEGDTLKIYYALSTFNPYTLVKMESDFKITRTDR
jgi:hypothetical protein